MTNPGAPEPTFDETSPEPLESDVNDSAMVTAAIELGWRLAQLYDDQEALTSAPRPLPNEPEGPPPHLPGRGERNDFERAMELVQRIGVACQMLGIVSADPLIADLRSVMQKDGHSVDDARRAVLALYEAGEGHLTTYPPRLATALGLGRLLADTCWLPRSSDSSSFEERFDYWRIGNAHWWLEELASSLPIGSSAAVRQSLVWWERFMVLRATSTITSRQLKARRDCEFVVRALHSQAEAWRILLTGERPAASVPSVGDHIGASLRLLRSVRRMTLRFFCHWSGLFAGLGAGLGATIWAVVTYAPSGAARLAGVTLSAVAALGLTWRGVGSTLGKALIRLEDPLRLAEADIATAIGVTTLPRGAAPPMRLERIRPQPLQAIDATQKDRQWAWQIHRHELQVVWRAPHSGNGQERPTPVGCAKPVQRAKHE
ncbi:MAG: hypothetical protein ACYDD4_05280 [Acidimicrobiales bacterium]